MRSVLGQMALVVDGQVVAGFAAEATLRFDDDRVDGVKVLWRPRVLPVQGVGEDGTRIERIRFSLFNFDFDLPGEPHGTGFVHLLKLSDEEWSVTVEELMPRDEARKRINTDGGVHLTHAGSVFGRTGPTSPAPRRGRRSTCWRTSSPSRRAGRRPRAVRSGRSEPMSSGRCGRRRNVGNRSGNRGWTPSARSLWASCSRLSWRYGVRVGGVTRSGRRSTGIESPTTRHAE